MGGTGPVALSARAALPAAWDRARAHASRCRCPRRAVWGALAFWPKTPGPRLPGAARMGLHTPGQNPLLSLLGRMQAPTWVWLGLCVMGLHRLPLAVLHLCWDMSFTDRDSWAQLYCLWGERQGGASVTAGSCRAARVRELLPSDPFGSPPPGLLPLPHPQCCHSSLSMLVPAGLCHIPRRGPAGQRALESPTVNGPYYVPGTSQPGQMSEVRQSSARGSPCRG